MDKQLKLIPNLLENVTWQYDGDVSLRSLISKKQDWYTVNWAVYWSNWHTSVFNIKTANRFGCVVWAIILGLPVGLVYNPNEVGSTLPFGFGPYRQNFNNANFFGANDTAALSLEEARKLLRVRYYSQTMSTTISNINAMLYDVFAEDGLAYVTEPAVMVQEYVFSFALTDNFKDALQAYLPRGAAIQTLISSP